MSDLDINKEAGNKEEGKNNRKFLLIGFIILLLAINGIQYFMGSKKDEKIEKQVVELKASDTKIKELSHELDSLENEIKSKIDEITKLGGDVTSLQAQLAQLQKDKVTLASNAATAKKNYASIAAKLDGLNAMLRDKDEEIEKLKKEQEHLFNENTGLKTTIVKKDSAFTEVDKKKRELEELVDKAKVLKATNIKVIAVTKRNKEKVDAKHSEEEFKAKNIDKINVVFTLADNKLAKVESKEILLRVLGPDGAALNNGDSFKYQGKDIYFSTKYTHFFDNKEGAPITISFSKGSEYLKGGHSIELYCEGQLIGTHSFRVK